MGMILSCCGQAASEVDSYAMPRLGEDATASQNVTDFAQQLGASAARPGEGATRSEGSSVSDIEEPAGTIGAPRSIVRFHGDPPVPVRCASPYRTADDAARDAIGGVNARSVKRNMEYAGLIYRRPDRGTFGVTGPVTERNADGFPSGNPLIRVPPDTNLAGTWHTHGDYSELDPQTGIIVRAPDAIRDEFHSDSFSVGDIEMQTELARGPENLSREQQDAWYTRIYGAPPTRRNMHFYVGTPSGDVRRHTPFEKPRTWATAAYDPDSNEIMDGHGSDVVLP